MQLTGPWTSNEVSASGQVFEFRLWALLTEQSRGTLHVFLPLSDRGVDALAHPFLVPTERLVERFGVSPTEALPPPVAPPPMWRSDLGALGEIETARLLAESGDLNLFRPFPDLETSELAALDLTTRRVLGIQIKTIGVDPAHPAGTVTIHASSFRPSPSTYLVALAWLREEHRFHDECLFIPTEELRSICRPREFGNHMSFDWHPGSPENTHLDKFRTTTRGLATDVQNRI